MLKKHRYKKHEINTGQDSSNIDFLSANRQFDKYLYSTIKVTNTSIYDSYKNELAAKTIKSVKLSNFTEVYSLTNEKKIDVDNLTQNYLVYKQFVTWSCNGSSVAPLTDYINNPIYQELITKMITSIVEGMKEFTLILGLVQSILVKPKN